MLRHREDPVSADERRFAVVESQRTVGSILDPLAPRREGQRILSWPPDVFGVTALLLHESEGFLFVVSPPDGEHWPPLAGWAELVRREAQSWVAGLDTSTRVRAPLLQRCWRTVSEARGVSLEALRLGRRWDVTAALLTLHALADEAGAAFSRPGGSPGSDFRSRAWALLARTGSLSQLPPTRVKVVPKTHLAQGGINLRSLSRHLASHSAPIKVSWGRASLAEMPFRRAQGVHTILVLPWPMVVRSSDFHPADGPLPGMDRSEFGFFQFDPPAGIDMAAVEHALQRALQETPTIDLVLFPEGAVLPDEIAPLEDLMSRFGVASLTAGVRQPATSSSGLGRNYAYLGLWTGERWQRVRTDKHHRWRLDASQIRQYGLSGVLSPRRMWWEAISIPHRSLHILDVEEVGPIAVLICEDLARLDPVAEVLRLVGPSLVIGLLLDGPQLATRWSCRYASVLADDPGSAVLTVTSLGMARRSHSPGGGRSRVVALWKDPDRGLREIEIERGATGVLLTVQAQQKTEWTADGRCHPDGTRGLVLEDVIQVPAARPIRAHAVPAR